jgi:RHS repeat-associated protein
VARILVSATGGPLADVEVTFLHNDAAGSPVAATSAAGAVKWSRGYQPYGEFSSQTGTATDTRQFFHGKPLDGESGLQYFGARYYDPLLGRFMAIDPAPWNETNLHSFNRYAFANNNPTRFTDPDGRAPTPIDGLFLLYDAGKLVAAVYTGVGIPAALADLGLSAAGILVPVPGGGQILKGLRGAEHVAEAAARGTLSVKAATKADSFEGVYQFAERGAQYVGETGRGAERLAEHIARGRPDPGQVIKIQEVAGGKLERQVVETQAIAKTGANLRKVESSPEVTNRLVPITESRAQRKGLNPSDLGYKPQ